MRLAGLQRFSLCDYPGKMAAVVFTQGCNFRCPFCHNGSLLSSRNPGQEISAKKIFSFLRERTGMLEGVVITGGEPTLQPDLADFCRAVRELGFLVKLDTNGSRPGVLKRLLADNLLDFIAMDIKATPERYHILAGVPVDIAAIIKSITVISRANIPALFRTTWVAGLHRQEERYLIPAMLPENTRHVFQPFKPEHALQPDLCGMEQSRAAGQAPGRRSGRLPSPVDVSPVDQV
ncbi:MAG TPA: anaerobic ribonucleoside-triphosphate reductase activating protein [Desulfobacteraceae bacterium]|nr:anaerobic ribonucleoside-triphosphate reductase activating protein [Desulfobacteraceae bacterium]